MKPIIAEMSDLSDSAEVYDSKPRAFFVIFIYLIVFIIGAAILWMYFFKMDIVVKAPGIVRAKERPMGVTNTVEGRVQKLFVEDGQMVHQGEILYMIERSDLEQELKAVNHSLTEVVRRIDRLEESRNQSNGLHTYDQEMNIYRLQKNELKNSRDTIQGSIENTIVIAKKSGRIELNMALAQGVYLDADVEVMSIVPGNGMEYVVECYIHNKDVGNLPEGLMVKYEMAAFPSSEYGSMTGKLVNIAKDARSPMETGGAYYVGKATVEHRAESNIQLMDGMECQVRMITRQKRILFYLLETIDLW